MLLVKRPRGDPEIGTAQSSQILQLWLLDVLHHNILSKTPSWVLDIQNMLELATQTTYCTHLDTSKPLILTVLPTQLSRPRRVGSAKASGRDREISRASVGHRRSLPRSPAWPPGSGLWIIPEGLGFRHLETKNFCKLWEVG